MNVDPSFWGVLLVLLAANSGLWRIMDRYINKHEGCGKELCLKTLSTSVLNSRSKES